MTLNIYNHCLLQLTIDFAAKQLFSGDLDDAPLKLSDMFNNLVDGLMSFPLNIPGTAHHRCLKVYTYTYMNS